MNVRFCASLRPRTCPPSAAVVFRIGDVNSARFRFGWLGPWRYNPSEGLLLKFSGDLVYLVLIRGSNLDKPLNEGASESGTSLWRVQSNGEEVDSKNGLTHGACHGRLTTV